MVDPRCTCPTSEPVPDNRPGVPLASGFTFHQRECPVVRGAHLSPEAQRLVDEKIESVRRARLAAMVSAQTAVVG